MKHIAIFIIVLLAAASTASAYTANFSNGFKIQDDALNNVFMVNKQGDVNFTGRMYGNGSGLTDLPASAVADAWVNASGDAMTGTLNVNNNANMSSSGDLNATGQTLLTKLGIGISKPTYMLHTGNGTDGAAVNLSNIIYINSTSGNILIGPGNTSNALDLTRQGRYMLNITGNMSVNNTFFVNTDGNVGIGTASPGQKLDVRGSAYVQDIIYLGRASVEKHLIFRNNNPSVPGTDNTAWSLSIRGDIGGDNNDLKIVRYNNAGTYQDIPIQISQSTGNVGIGTASPASALHVIGSINASTSFKAANGTQAAPSYTFSDDTNTGFIKPHEDNISIVTGGVTRMVIDPSGNVGIGTTAPEAVTHIASGTVATDVTKPAEALLVLEGSASNNWIQFQNAVTQNAGIEWGDPDDNDIAFIYYDHNVNDMNFGANTGTDLTIDSTGNVGIGTVSPGAKLEISGSDGVGYNIYSTTGGYVKKWYYTGTIGISPADNTEDITIPYLKGVYSTKAIISHASTGNAYAYEEARFVAAYNSPTVDVTKIATVASGNSGGTVVVTAAGSGTTNIIFTITNNNANNVRYGLEIELVNPW